MKISGVRECKGFIDLLMVIFIYILITLCKGDLKLVVDGTNC
jgi:hypothetical protein